MPGGGAFLPTTQTMVTMGVIPFQGKTHMVEAGIEPGTSRLVVRNYNIIYNKPARCNSGSIVFNKNYKYALHVSDALCVHLQEHYKL